MSQLLPAVVRLLQRPEPERRIGPFVLVKQLGRGGFAPVWLAREVYGEVELRAAAVKLFSLDASCDPIVAEARALCQVEHPNVVRFYALSIDEAEGVMALAMEHVAGTPLDARIAAEGALPATEALRVGIAIASALSAVHRAGLVHRDVKPSNIIDAAGVYKLIDFGIAAGDAAAPAPVEVVPIGNGGVSPLVETAPEETVRLQSGTRGYVDPACVATGAPAAPESDLYALGATLYECLTGRVPASAALPKGAFDPHVLTGAALPPRLAELAADVPPPLAALVERMISPDRRDRPRSAEWVAIRLEQIRRALAGLERALPPEEEGPFRGLLRFEERDRDVHFGRASEVAAALEVLRGRGLLALVGASGSGKSSLARAGVLPALADGGLGGWPEVWDTAIAEPGRDARAALAAALSPFVPDADQQSPEAVVAALAERVQATGRGVALLCDQLEELTTRDADKTGRAWIAALLCRVADQALPGVRAVVAVRRDLLDPLLGVGNLGKAISRGLVLIEPINDLGWSDVLDQALAAYGYTIEDDALRAEIVAELQACAGAMPLIQFALAALWEKRDRDRKEITRAGLRAIGGVVGALEQHADETLLSLSRAVPGGAEVARQVLLALTTPEGTRAARAPEEIAEAFGEAGEAAIEALGRARLIVPTLGGVTIAHEALLSQWGRLRAWVDEARGHRLLAEELERDAARWRADPEAVSLWRRRRVAYAQELERRGSLPVSKDALDFLRASRRSALRARMALAVAAALAAASLLGAGVSYVRAVQANEAAARAEETAAREALEHEHEARHDAEEQRRSLKEANDKLQAANADITRLTGELFAARTEKEKSDIVTRIQTLSEPSREVRSTEPPPTSPPPTSPPPTSPPTLQPELQADPEPSSEPHPKPLAAASEPATGLPVPPLKKWK